MRAVSALNALLLVVALTTSLALTWVVAVRDAGSSTRDGVPVEPNVVRDSEGVDVPVRSYRRIASVSTIADEVLVDIVEPSRLVAVTRHTLESGDRPWRFEGKTGIRTSKDVEAIIALEPDIVFVNGFTDLRHLARMRDAGLNVFNLGAMYGLETLLPNIDQISTVVGARDRGRILADDFERRMAAVAAGLPDDEKKGAVYVGIYGDRLYGGTVGTSVHDVLSAAGVVDLAASAGYTGSPAYSNEQLLSLDPPWIITNEPGEDTLCALSGLKTLRACKERNVRTVDADLMSDPGLGMLRAAEAVHEVMYPDRG
jgi:iron complex transport system substrate-binding protein